MSTLNCFASALEASFPNSPVKTAVVVMAAPVHLPRPALLSVVVSRPTR